MNLWKYITRSSKIERLLCTWMTSSRDLEKEKLISLISETRNNYSVGKNEAATAKEEVVPS